MKEKLLLASLNYQAEGNHFTLTRLVVVTDEDRKSGLNDPQIATRKAEQWFNKNRENVTIESIIAYDAIDEPLVWGTVTEKVFDASWFPSTVFPKEYEENCGYSDDVLIDRTGKRKNFVVGWYDFDEKKWIVSHGIDELEPSELVWQYLPLAKYDKS